jgi:HEAT repeat protein
MSFWSLLRPFELAWDFVYRLWQRLDAGLVRLARPFGVNITDPAVQHTRFIAIYLVIYLVALLPVPVLPLLALAVGYVGVVVVGRAWVANEKERARIAKKLVEGKPDEMPDLRWVALASALQLLLLFPLLYQQMQRHFGLYHVPDGANFWSWVVFTFDMYSQSFLGLLDLYGIHITSITYSSPWGRHLATVERFTLYYVLIQGITRLFAIRETVQDAVAAVTADPDMAVRVGRRAVDALIVKLQDPVPLVRRRAAEALGLLKDRSAVGPLVRALLDADGGVRAQAAEALGQIRSVRALGPLTGALADPEAAVRLKAVAALGALGDPEAVAFLGRRLSADPDEEVRLGAVQALVRLGGEEARGLLLEALHDAGQPRAVVLRVNELLGAGERDLLVDTYVANLGRPPGGGLLRSVGRWVRPGRRKVDARAHDLEVRKRQHAAESLGELGDGRAVGPLLQSLQDRREESEVRAAAAEALGKLGDLRAVEALLRAATDHKEKWSVREQSRAALQKLGAPAPAKSGTP